MKAHAPPPPQAPQPAPRHIFRNTAPDGGGTSGMDAKENILRPTVDVQLTLPQGQRVSITEDGSKALMDLLVELCSHYHLNPALHTLELLSPEGHSLGFKPNALLGSLNVACVLIKEKVLEEKVVRRPAPKVPEKTVRLMVNYHGSQKAVVRVNPLVPLQTLIPVICDKCEFEPAHVLLLKDSISRHELQLDKSLSELGIKELYVHDQSLDSIRSSTSSLGRPEKKGLLGIFQFSRRKSKTETRSMDMDDYDETFIQNTDTQFNALSTVSGVPSLEDRPGTLGQSQSVMSIPRMSPKADPKKRRAPAPPGAPTPSMGHTSFESYQMGLGSESQQRKRKAPAPPPTPTSLTQGSDDASTSAAPSPDGQATEIPTPAFRTTVVQSTTVSTATVVMETVKPGPIKIEAQPPPVSNATPTPSSPTPSSSTTDSLVVQDSSSELSHSLDDSDADLDQAGSHCSTLTSSTASGSVWVNATAKSSSSKMEESATVIVVKLKEEVTSDSSSRSETESALNLKLDEVENNRHSAMGSTDRQVPPKPRRTPTRESPQHALHPTLTPPQNESTESLPVQNPMEEEESAPQSWLHSARSSAASDQKQENGVAEDETVSLGSSSSSSRGSSLPDQGYAASEGMAEGEDSGMVSSPSDTQPTSPDGSLSLDGSGRGRGEKLLRPVRDSSSDSDEGCATWGSMHRHNDVIPESQSVRLKNSFEEDPELTAQLHQTLADFEADLADQDDILSARETPDAMSTDSNEVPVSVVDMDVPVTAIDEVMEVYERSTVEHEAKSLTRTESAGSKGPDLHQTSSIETQNKNNNAYTAAVSQKKQKEKSKKQHSKPLENKSTGDRMEEKMLETKNKEMSAADTKRGKEDKQISVKSNAEMQKKPKKTEKSPDPVKKNSQSFQQRKNDLPMSQRLVSTEKEEENHRVYQIKSNSGSSHGKITHVTSRFGMKTFTVVPPKPSVTHTAGEQPAVPFTAGAIRIDDQGNMVSSGVFRNKVGGSSETEINRNEGSPLVGQAKAFWSSNEKQESAVIPSKGLIDKAKESTNGEKSASTAVFETTLKTSKTEYLKTTQSTLSKPTEKVQLIELVKEEANEPGKDVKAANEEYSKVESKISVSKNSQQPSIKPALPPPLLADMRRDLSFLKPSRRTSSQYVASAISKYTPMTSAKPISTPKTPDYSASSKTPTPGLQRLGQSIQVNPHQSSLSYVSDNKENVSTSTSRSPGPKRSMSSPEYVSDTRRDFEKFDRGGFKSSVVSTKESLGLLETETAKNNHIHSSGPTHIKVTANNDRDYNKHIRQRSPSPAKTSTLHSYAKPPTAPKTISQDQTNNLKDMIKTATPLTTNGKPQPSVTVTDSAVTPPAVTVFGPIAKFKPVIYRSVEKETSLHSNLMEAIQTGGGRDRLKKISTSGSSNLKKGPYIEEENERSALLAAIRAQSNTGRLRKTRSVASHELEKLRKMGAEEERSAASSSSTVFTAPPPPPPPAPMTAPPPPPPPVLPQAKPSSVAHPNANAPMNLALAREAMLEAIRSGSAAERLKKIAVPRNTVQVNGRLGTIQATSSAIPQQ